MDFKTGGGHFVHCSRQADREATPDWITDYNEVTAFGAVLVDSGSVDVQDLQYFYEKRDMG